MIAVVVVVFDVAASLTLFAKSAVLYGLIFSYLGVVTAKPTLIRASVGMIMVVGVFVALQPLVMYGRDVLISRYGELEGGGFDERVGIVQDYFLRKPDIGRTSDKIQWPLLRLSYVNVGCMVLDQYDFGRPGNTMDYWLAVLIPRILWPDKPEITAVGEDVYYLATGRSGSWFAEGLFAEAYWNLGWWGLPVLMAPLGVVLAMYSRFSVGVVRRGDWYLLPIVFFGASIGLRADGHYVADVIGGTWTSLWIYLGVSGMRAVVQAAGGQRNRRSIPIHPAAVLRGEVPKPSSGDGTGR